MATRNWNPHEPTILGMEWAALRELSVPISQDAEYGYTLQADATETVDTASFLIVDPPGTFLTVCTPLVTVYARDAETLVGTPQTTVVAVNGGALAGAAALGGGAATITDALASPSDAGYVELPDGGGNTLTLEFATAGLFVGKRILELRVRYMGTAQQIVENVTERVTIETLSGVVIGVRGAPQIERAGASALPIRTVSLGEVNYMIAGSNEVWPWTVAEVQDFDSGVNNVRFLSPQLGFDVRLHYVALEVVWCEENRQAVGALRMRQTWDDPAAGVHTVDLRQPDGTDNWPKTLDDWYTVSLCSARSPGPFVDALESVADDKMMQTQGPQPFVAMLDAFEVFDQHAGRIMPRNSSNVILSAADDSRIVPIQFVTTTPSTCYDGATYDALFTAEVFNGSSSKGQEIGERSGGAVTYPWLTVWVRRIGEPAGDIAVSYVSVAAVTYTTTITEAEILAADEVFDGWRKVVHAWGAGPPVLANTGNDGDLTFTTAGTSDAANRYELLGVKTLRLGGGAGGPAGYGDGDSYTYKDAGTPYIYLTMVTSLATEVPLPANFAAEVASQSLAQRATGSACQVTRFDYASLSWDVSAMSDTDFAYYEIQRKDTITTTWATIGKITDKTRLGFFDVEARCAVTSTYRMRAVRFDGIVSAWSAEKTVAVTAGDTNTNLGCGFLMFSSNEHTAYTCVFADSYDNDPTAGYHFVEADDYALVRHFGRDYTQGFHGTERGGVTFDRTLLVNGGDGPTSLGGISSGTVTYGDHDFDVLRTIAYADLPYVCVKDDLGNRWFAVVQVPDATIRRPGAIELATVRVTEASGEPWPADDQFDV